METTDLPSDHFWDTEEAAQEYRAIGQGSLVVQNVESETLQGAVGFGREKKRTGAYVHLRITYSYEKRVVWYTPTGDVGMSGFEHSLLSATSPNASPNSLYDKLLEEVKQE